MSDARFEWDDEKAEKNLDKHGVSFDEASTVIDDAHVLMLPDWEHGEPRLLAIGMSARSRVLFVVTLELDNDRYRIISARKANRHERKQYEEGD